MSNTVKEIGMLSYVKIVANDVYKGEMGIITNIIHDSPDGKDYYYVILRLGSYRMYLQEDLILASEKEIEEWIKSSK